MAGPPADMTTRPPDMPSSTPEDCANGIDDNGDGDVDCLDAMCAPTAACGQCVYVPQPAGVAQAPQT